MGMTIKENIEILRDHLLTLNVDEGLAFYQEIEVIQSVIEIMRKYQKIEEIWDKWHIDMSVKTNVAMSQIGEVLKDGNNG